MGEHWNGRCMRKVILRTRAPRIKEEMMRMILHRPPPIQRDPMRLPPMKT